MELSMRYAHCEGHTEVVYDDGGKHLITCGSDGDVRIFLSVEDDEPKTHHMGEAVNTLHFKNGLIYIPTDSNAVVAYNFPEVTCEGIVLQFFTTVYHITCNSTGRLVAAGGGDFTVKIYDNNAKSLNVCRGHDAPILSLAFDPEDKYLASSSCDGTVRIWQLSDYECIKILNVIKKSNDFCNSETLCRLQWHPKKGKFLAVPVRQEVRFYEKDSWTYNVVLHEKSLTDKTILSVVAFSHCGQYIAAGATDGTLLVWDLKMVKLVTMKNDLKNVSLCSLAWNPMGANEIAFSDSSGQLGIYSGTFTDSSDNQAAAAEPLRNGLSSGASDADIEINHMEDDGMTRKIPEAFEDDDDDDNAFDIGAIKAKFEPKIFGLEDEDPIVSTTTEPALDEGKPKQAEAPTTPLQTSFQPSSTPLHLAHRFMLWNDVGIVRSYDTDEENSIDVEFHDASTYHPIHVNNIHSFTMASLSVEALLLASSKLDDAVSKLHCMHIASWDLHKEWTIDMAEDEDIEAISLGSRWAAVGTDKRLIRLFSLSGIQCEVFCVSGPVVCLAGYENQLAIAYHQGTGLPGEQNLGLMFVNVDLKTHSTCKKFDLPVTSKSFLTWMGFTDEGQLCTVDTTGEVRLLTIHRGAKWVPIANTKSNVKGKSDNYFVIGLSEIRQEIRGIPCKGARYPSILPRPTVTSIPFSLPFCEMSKDKGKLEEENARSSALHIRIRSLLASGFSLDTELSDLEKRWTVTLLKMFALATKCDSEFRAVDIAEMMPSSRMVQGAIKYAAQKNHMGLAQRLGEVMYKKTAEESASAEAATEEEEEEFVVPTPSNFTKSIGFSSRLDDNVKPKALIRRNRNSLKKPEDLMENHNESESKENTLNKQSELYDEKTDSISCSLPSSNHKVINPFKVADKASSSSDKSNKSRIDDLQFESTPKTSSKAAQNSTTVEKKAAKQSKLFEQMPESSNLTPKKFGFALFLEEKRDELKGNNPSMEESDIIKTATRMFKELPAEEKEKYKNTPKSARAFSEATSNGKRKLDSEASNSKSSEQSTAKKSKKEREASVSSSTNNPFSMYAFVKRIKE